jgi:hypothetical protein
VTCFLVSLLDEFLHADEKLTAFLELQTALHEFAVGFSLYHFLVALWRAKKAESDAREEVDNYYRNLAASISDIGAC